MIQTLSLSIAINAALLILVLKSIDRRIAEAEEKNKKHVLDIIDYLFSPNIEDTEIKLPQDNLNKMSDVGTRNLLKDLGLFNKN